MREGESALDHAPAIETAMADRAGAPPPADQSVESAVAEHQGALLRYAERIVRDPEAAQDAVQEAFLRYVRAGREGKPIQSISTWLFRVTHNVCVDHIRKERRMREGIEQMDPPVAMAPPPIVEVAAAERREKLDAMLERLTENQRTVLVLKMQEDKSYKEISAITGLSVSNVGFLIHRAVRRLGEFARREELI